MNKLNIYGEEIKVLPMSDRDVRCVERNGEIIYAALSDEGMYQLTHIANNELDKRIKKIWKLADGRTVHMIAFLKDQKESDKEDQKIVFVFGSNMAGRHGKGAARFALENHGAIYGIAEGLQGNSYAIPTRDRNIKTLPLNEIKIYVDNFIKYATDHPEMLFVLTRVGCGLAGYTDNDIFPMFKGVPVNCVLPEEWSK